jgi:hypothetical protein
VIQASDMRVAYCWVLNHVVNIKKWHVVNLYTHYCGGWNSIIFVKEGQYRKLEIERLHLLLHHSVTKLYVA